MPDFVVAASNYGIGWTQAATAPSERIKATSMANRETHSVRAYWYEPDSELDKRAYASLGGIVRLISDLALIRGELAQVSRSRDAGAIAELCRYHYENFLFRTYMLRERVWDVVSILADIKREGTGKKQFRAAVLSRLSQTYPEVYSVFSFQ